MACKSHSQEEMNKLREELRKLLSVQEEGMPPDPHSSYSERGTAGGPATLIEEQLKDALEKNQQWLVYDQQREAYIKAVLAEKYQLQQELHKAKKGIKALETLREKNSRQILARDQKIGLLKQLPQSDCAEVVTGLHAQLNQQRADAEITERLFQTLRQETEELKNKLTAVLNKCQDRENTCNSGTAGGPATLIEEQLKDALEKNQQWLVYDQQREAYIKAVLAEKYQLQQELHKAKKVTVLQNSLLNQHEDQSRMMVLEQQKIQSWTSSSVPHVGVEMVTDPKDSHRSLSSATRHPHSLLDESFLECPNCGAQFPASRHRELLLHVDECCDYS